MVLTREEIRECENSMPRNYTVDNLRMRMRIKEIEKDLKAYEEKSIKACFSMPKGLLEAVQGNTITAK